MDYYSVNTSQVFLKLLLFFIILFFCDRAITSPAPQSPFFQLPVVGALLLMILILLAASAIYNSDRLFPFLHRPNSIGFGREIPELLGQEENSASPARYMSTYVTCTFDHGFPSLLSHVFEDVS